MILNLKSKVAEDFPQCRRSGKGSPQNPLQTGSQMALLYEITESTRAGHAQLGQYCRTHCLEGLESAEHL